MQAIGEILLLMIQISRFARVGFKIVQVNGRPAEWCKAVDQQLPVAATNGGLAEIAERQAPEECPLFVGRGVIHEITAIEIQRF